MGELIRKSDAIEALGERPSNWGDTESEIQAVADWDYDYAMIEAVEPVVDLEEFLIPVCDRVPDAGHTYKDEDTLHFSDPILFKLKTGEFRIGDYSPDDPVFGEIFASDEEWYGIKEVESWVLLPVEN